MRILKEKRMYLQIFSNYLLKERSYNKSIYDYYNFRYKKLCANASC